MRIFKGWTSYPGIISRVFLVAILGSIFITGVFIWREVNNFNYQKIFSENAKVRDDNSSKEVNDVKNESGILAIAYYEDNTNSSLILEKVDVENMEVIEKKVLKLGAGGIGDYGQRDFSDPSQSVQFSPNGEDIFLLQREFPSPASSRS